MSHLGIGSDIQSVCEDRHIIIYREIVPVREEYAAKDNRSALICFLGQVSRIVVPHLQQPVAFTQYDVCFPMGLKERIPHHP